MSDVATLINRTGTPMVLTARRTVDARTGLARGIADYLRSLSIEIEGGRVIGLDVVRDTWVETEDKQGGIAPDGSAEIIHTGAAIKTMGPAALADPSFSGTRASDENRVGENTWLLSKSDLLQKFTIEVYAEDPEARVGLAMMLEDAWNPVEWMGGWMMDLPYYYGARAQYALDEIEFIDSEQNALQRQNLAIFTVHGSVPQLRAHRFPIAKLSSETRVGTDPRLLT